MAFELEFTPDAWEHLQGFTARDRNIILEAISTQLCYEPNLETRNRKPLQDNPLATWELRVGKFRVFYDIEDNSVKIVYIIAIGFKDHNKLFIGTEEIEL
ncbi:type II toxin-antitoxin system RelE/ParE family toxin [Roseofilum sp. BLCC_M154]|uniref:Type II toxin-antitoxin system RelE/ParE family toxin n=1 Tax=Roseofilum acuticapitatum BLCC-M154 TaxID=3022444 RepID=A0ABT7AZA0_9CYAN|nr:hypothetical protein [Roseofilum acuticapitatum]MDJ1172243.1 type II toxin-antitoxin system RelE/ParE family toxin [Roseofilum acuticapitatum BLCC-M154]